MGTVGISFGSPTSGAGFDVSTTVAQIVGNLQNVETPWKTQLASLQAQDTSISSLGTLFSNLSNDMSSLTDLEGILAEKTGSSSDTNVVEVTAATAGALAGTHTVEVTSLATTSSGYLAAVTSASDTLAGSITLQVGTNGTPATITLSSSNNTLSGLAAAINSSAVGVTASVLTDSSGSRLSLVSATSGAAGNIVVNANSITDTSSLLAYSGSAGSATQTSTGTLAGIVNAGDSLAGEISIQVGSGTAKFVSLGSAPSGGAAVNTLYTGTSVNTLASLESFITANTATLGVTASVVTANGVSSLSLLSNTALSAAGTLTVKSNIMDTSDALAYASPVSGADAKLTVDGINLTNASNTVANLIPGITLQLLAPSSNGEQVQVVIGNDNTNVESTVNQFVTDYNSLMTAMNTQDGNTSSGTPEPLFGSPTLSLLQQQLLSGLNTVNPNGSLAPIASTPGTTLSGSISIAVAGGTAENFVFGAAPVPPLANTTYTGAATADNTLSGMASAINAANLGYTATVVTASGQSSLTLTSQTAGASGALSVSSKIVAVSDARLSYYDESPYTATTADSGATTAIAGASDALSGSIAIQMGNGTTQTIAVPAHSATSPSNTLSGLAGAINAANIGVTASLNTVAVGKNAIGTILTLTSGTVGSAGALAVTSNLLDTTNTTSSTLAYTNSSDINSLTGLGISVNNDGSITFDATSLDSLLNTDYTGVVGFFQNSNSWGQNFSTMLTNAGTGTATGILSLASSSNSNIESTLNADISKENTYISAQQTSLTAELNSANEIMQELPSQLDGVNELYSAITGYNQNQGG